MVLSRLFFNNRLSCLNSRFTLFPSALQTPTGQRLAEPSTQTFSGTDLRVVSVSQSDIDFQAGLCPTTRFFFFFFLQVLRSEQFNKSPLWPFRFHDPSWLPVSVSLLRLVGPIDLSLILPAVQHILLLILSRYFDENQISQLAPDLVRRLTRLQTLDFRQNPLTELSGSFFAGLTLLTEMYASTKG